MRVRIILSHNQFPPHPFSESPLPLDRRLSVASRKGHSRSQKTEGIPFLAFIKQMKKCCMHLGEERCCGRATEDSAFCIWKEFKTSPQEKEELDVKWESRVISTYDLCRGRMCAMSGIVSPKILRWSPNPRYLWMRPSFWIRNFWFTDEIQFRRGHIGSNGWCPKNKKTFWTQRHRHRRDGSVKAKAEVVVMRLQADGHRGLPTNTRTWKR